MAEEDLPLWKHVNWATVVMYAIVGAFFASFAAMFGVGPEEGLGPYILGAIAGAIVSILVQAMQLNR